MDEHLHAIGEDLGPAVAGSGRTLLVNVDSLLVPAEVAQAIGQIVRDIVAYALDHALRGGAGIVQIACGANREGGMTLEITDEGFGGEKAPGSSLPGAAATRVARLVSQLGAQLTVETSNPRLRCTIVIPADARP